MSDNLSKVVEIDVNDILPNRFQPRIQFNETEILELSDSIKEHGVLQPLLVRKVGDKYEIIAGERRYKAAVLAGKETVPCIIKNLNDKECAEIALTENLQRKNLNAIEEALSYQRIMDMGYITQTALASKLGKSQSAIANKIRLLELSDKAQEALLENKISERHARSLLRLKSNTQQNEMLDKIIKERLTVRKTDEAIINVLEGKEEKGEKIMNNENIFSQSHTFEQSAPQPTVPNFDIFGSTSTAPIQPTVESQPQAIPSFDVFSTTQATQPEVQPTVETPIIEPIAEPQPTVPNFDIFGSSTPVPPVIETLAPQPQSVPEVPVMPEVQPTVETPITPIIPEIPQVPPMMETPVAPVIPEVQPAVETPIIEPTVALQPTVPNFDIFGSSTPVSPVIETSAPQPQSVPEVPQTAPILESPTTEMTQQGDNLFGFSPTPMVPEVQSVVEPQPIIEPQPTIAETTVQPIEPIIVTDYTKQYDPIMPTIQQPIVNKADFKEVIKLIRECSENIEKFGYKIDVEEYDLENLYQAVFKIDKA